MRQDEGATDRWAAWLLHRRHADDPEQRRMALDQLLPIRDRVLDNARLRPGDVVLDVGAGDGLIAFGAAERVGHTGRVIISDISTQLLEHARTAAAELGFVDRMSFLEARAEELAGIADQTVDVVTARSVLIYVADKDRAFEQFHRVLRTGGRLSIFEPINSYFPETPDEFWGFDSTAVRDLVQKLLEFEGWNEAAYSDDPMMNFTERDLLRSAAAAGFREIHIELLIDVQPGTWVVDWDRLLGASPNPNAHTVGELLDAALTDDERARFERHIRPLADTGRGVKRSAFAYLHAVKG
jgi:arsenite methyltransferase